MVHSSEIRRRHMDFRFVVAILLLSTVKAAEPGVTFWREDITMTCPEKGDWYNTRNTTVLEEGLLEDGKKYTMKYTGSRDVYYCQYGDDPTKTKYYFYVQGKACANCYEVDALLFLVVIVVDLLGTIVAMFFIYRCTKKKNLAAPAKPSKSPARSGGRGPPVPSPDYEALSPHNRSQDTYSTVNRMA